MKEQELTGVWKDTTGWFADEGWRAGSDGSFYLESDDEKSMYVYESLGYEDSEYTYLQLVLWLKDEPFVLQEEKTDDGIDYRLIVPPYKDHFVNPRDSWCGVVYGPDGKMEKNRNVKGLPKKIDMEETVKLFLEQLAEKRFEKPRLVGFNKRDGKN